MSVIDFAGKLRLEVLTSAHVWSGEELYKGIDYCCQQDRLFIVDPIKILEAHRERDIRYGCYPPRNMVIETLKVHDRDVCTPRSIKKHIRIGGKRTIPGSSVKGLLRTSYIYGVLKSDNQLLNQVNDLIHSELDDINTSILTGQRRQARREIKNVASSMEEQLLKLIVRAGSLEYILDALNRVIVSDPVAYGKLSHGARTIYVYEIPRLARRDTRPRFMVPVEAIDKGSTIIYDLKIMKREGFNVDRGDKSSIESLYRKISIDEITRGLEVFSRDLVEYELGRIRGISDELIGDYRRFLQDIRGKISSREFYLRIGYMTGHNAKTIDLLLRDNVRKLLEDVMTKIYNHTWDSLTLKLTRINEKFYGFGWIKITLQG